MSETRAHDLQAREAQAPPLAAHRGSTRLGALLWSAAFALLVLLGVKTFVADVYRISSSSMEPTVFGGAALAENVLVHYTSSPVERFDLVVVQRAGDRDPVVKRVAGLPGETVAIVGGDLIIDGARLGADAARPPAIGVYDSASRPIEEVFHFKQAPRGPWSPASEAGVWDVDAREVEPGSNRGMMLFSPDVRDTYEHPDGQVRGGLHQVGDVILEVEVVSSDTGGRLRFLLVEEGDTFEAAITPGEGDLGHATLERWVAGAPNDVLASTELRWKLGAWHRVRFANVDNSLVFEVGEIGGANAARVTQGYASNEPYPGTTQGADLSVGARTGFGARGVRASFRGARVLRDLFYTSRGTYAVKSPVTLGLGEVFLLGDNSSDSRDSRFWGPVAESEIVGRPVAVVWPWGGRRLLSGSR